MSEETKKPQEKKTASVGRPVLINETYTYHLTMLLFISSIVLCYSFTIFPSINTLVMRRPRSLQDFLMSIRSYSFYANYGVGWWLLNKIVRIPMLSWINVLVRLLMTTAVSIWGIVALKKTKRQVFAPLCILMALFSIYLTGIIFWMMELVNVRINAKEMMRILGNFFRDYHTLAYILMIVCALVCLIGLSRKFNTNPRMRDPAKKEITGVRGWLVFAVIRYLGVSLSFAVMYAFAFLFSTGVRLRALPIIRMEMLFSYFHWDMMLFIGMIEVLAVLLVIMLVSKNRKFPGFAMAFETLLIAFGVLFCFYFTVLTIVSTRNYLNLIYLIGSQLISIGWSIFFIVYYRKSDRVQNTFVR